MTIAQLMHQGSLTFGDGYRTKRSEHGRPGLPILRVAEVHNGSIRPEFSDYVSDAYRSAMGAKISQPGDIVLTTKGTVGRVAIIPDDAPPFVYSPQVCYFRVTESGTLDRRFLYYWFQGSEFWGQARHRKSQTDMADYLNMADIRSLRITVPERSQQKAIARILGALDDKIAVGSRIATMADQLSSELFRHAILMSSDQFTEQALSATAEFINGRAFTKDATGTGRMVVRIAEINSGPGSSTVYNDIDVPEKHLARAGDVLFAWSGSLTVTRWFRPEAIINQHIFKCVPKNSFPQWLVSQLVHRKIDEFRAIAADKATTMGHIQRKHLDEPVPVPAQEALSSLDAQIAPLWERALLAEQENLALATLRDTLIPQLMSGRLRVRDAEKIVEDHV
ncbi:MULTISPECIES: restriction endonuclease subunit S [unclassified Streptomyces]|uniref:restriction endonuclease subunit S n=1 Tax=unclassified Streptomyces TaxID=2593676 RepID=UPI00131AFEF2|nr:MULTISPECIES: restriction endonuclease subunit S [unclassified Streptomyces]